MTPTFSAAGLNSPGTRSVSLRVTDAGGLSAVDTDYVTVVIAALQDDPLHGANNARRRWQHGR